MYIPAAIFSLLPPLPGPHRDISEHSGGLRIGDAPLVEQTDHRALHRLDFPRREIGCRSQRFTLDLHQLPLEPPLLISVNMSIDRQFSRQPWKNSPERRSASRTPAQKNGGKGK